MCKDLKKSRPSLLESSAELAACGAAAKEGRVRGQCMPSISSKPIRLLRRAHTHSHQAPVVCADSVHLQSAFAADDRAYSSLRLRAALQQQCVALGWHRLAP